MSVDTTHSSYDLFAPKWLRARHVVEGEDAIKLAGESYLPKLTGQTDAEFTAYVNRGTFYNASGRSAEAFEGLIFRRSPLIRLPESNDLVGNAMAKLGNDVDLLGTLLYQYAKRLVSEVIVIGRAGTLVDWNEDEQRAYLSFYSAENILNWKVQRINGRMQLVLLVLSESVDTDGDDEFDVVAENQIRVYRLGPNGVSVVAYRRRDNEWIVVEESEPKRKGKALSEIPFVFHGPIHSRSDIQKGPLEDVIAVNLHHYRLSADYAHGLHYTALPTAWVAGFDRSTELKIGSTQAWVTDQLGATAGFLEFEGQGLRSFVDSLDRDERLMAVLGSRLLEGQKKTAESAEALSIRQAGEGSILSNIATSVSKSLSHALHWAYWWHSNEESPSDVTEDKILIELNTDYETAAMNSQDLTALVASWQAGAISRGTMLDKLRQGEVLPPGRTNEEEIEMIAAQMPLLPREQASE